MRTEELNFELPPHLIAQVPASDRTASRLLHYEKASGAISHGLFSDLPRLLRAGDLLVFNDSRVIPARLTLRKSTGGLVEGLFMHEDAPGQWRVLLRDVSRLRPDATLNFFDAPEVTARITEAFGQGEYSLCVSSTLPAIELLARVGRMPLPPYIKRGKSHDERDELDRARYQTVYAQAPGSVAAPTAGLHFTREILAELSARGVEQAFVTLHVGIGTFKPIACDTLEAHDMHEESFCISPEFAAQINRAKSEGRRVIAVGTTAARVLESQPIDRPIMPGSGSTRILIFPPYQWKHVDALITNFHLPRSTLIALVAALTGVTEQRRIYSAAVAEQYRFFSYGDAMLVD